MNKLEATLEEVVNMLVVFEGTIKKDKPVLLLGFFFLCEEGAQTQEQEAFCSCEGGKVCQEAKGKGF
ncbi:hypothetical protein F511_47285 [Dorcoceras hygrometricum]|uniref:Uncharacterized protein n=1 Tax=Dorcoceras hygrometricum TaxID=472368 RepID=A0A2Z6ZRZ5_9LAMI|nr:hypothetical protein F511_47285 [Dorcoceras hygrometricum]